MRIGLSWDFEAYDDWKAVMAEIVEADQMGYESAWIFEGRESANSCSSPTIFLTWAAQHTRNIQLRSAGRTVGHVSPVRLAEEIAVLDLFSRGRAGVALASGSAGGVPARHVNELAEFVASAWATDEMRYRGEHIRFPTHTPDDAPRGTSEPGFDPSWRPQWEWGPVTPDFLAITPKPYINQPPIHMEISDDETLEWAAKNGIGPLITADTPTPEAVERLVRYREVADEAGRKRREVEAVLERRINLDGAPDDCALGGTSEELQLTIRELSAKTSFSHFVWRRTGAAPLDLYRFSAAVQMLLQA